MRPKDFENANFYEILNISTSASQKEIKKAYDVNKAAYGYGALASYGLVSEEDRRSTLQYIEDAYQTLRNPRRRKNYDRKNLRHSPASREEAYFRSTTEKILIEDGGKAPGFCLQVLRRLLGKRA
jgi:DnaJ-class molecular chaperone